MIYLGKVHTHCTLSQKILHGDEIRWSLTFYCLKILLHFYNMAHLTRNNFCSIRLLHQNNKSAFWGQTMRGATVRNGRLSVTAATQPGKNIIWIEWHFKSLVTRGHDLSVICTLHLESRSVMCIGAEEKQAHRCDPYDLRVQEQPLFLVCSSTVFLLLWIKSHRSTNIDAGADQK